MNPQCNLTRLFRKGAAWRMALTAMTLVVATVPASVLAGEDIDEVRPLAANGHILVENSFGEIDVQGWDREEVRISGYLSDDVKELEIRESGNGLRIRVDYYDRRTIDGAHLEITMPKGGSLEADSVSGDIEAAGLSGESIDLRTVSGDLDVAASPQRLTLNTVSGDIEFPGTAARVDVESVSGEIDLTGVSGEIEATTVSGDVTVSGGSLQSGEFEAVSGDVELVIALEAGGRITVSSMSGDIDLYLPRSQQAEFFAQTFSGDIDTAFGSAKDSSRGPGSRLEHQEGNGGATINLNSFSGDVSIYKR
jgi:DUF4097 and DUF4098 domain-containing protein YvlB